MDPIMQHNLDKVMNTVQSAVKNFTTASRMRRGSDDPDRRRSIDDECGYPDTESLTLDDYRRMYDRNPIARRVVEVFPEQCWQITPEVYEDDDPETETAFEKALAEMGQNLHGKSFHNSEHGNQVWEYLSRLDKLCGVGHYGVMLIGVSGDEGADLLNPLDLKEGGTPKELIYLKVFPEHMATVSTWDTDNKSPRFRQPVTYNLDFDDFAGMRVTTDSSTRPTASTVEVHWTRILHVADGLESDDVIGIPRSRPVFNRLMDCDKLFGGSAEMYWQGAMPGFSWETHPQLGGDVEIDADGFRTQLQQYMNSLQRNVISSGMTAQSLAPQVVDPTPQIDIQIKAICVKLPCPKRIFEGSERGELSSGQDDDTWEDVLTGRRTRFVTPRIVVPFINRLILLNVLPVPSDGYGVRWPVDDTLRPIEQADVALKVTQALVAYVAGDGIQIIPPAEYLTQIIGMDQDEADAVIAALEKDGLMDRLIAEEPSPMEMMDHASELKQTEAAQFPPGKPTAKPNEKPAKGTPPKGTPPKGKPPKGKEGTIKAGKDKKK